MRAKQKNKSRDTYLFLRVCLEREIVSFASFSFIEFKSNWPRNVKLAVRDRTGHVALNNSRSKFAENQKANLSRLGLVLDKN
jgi:hypothetical protein